MNLFQAPPYSRKATVQDRSVPAFSPREHAWRRAGRKLEQRWGGWVLRRRWSILAASLLAAVISLPGLFRLRFDDDVGVLFGPENPEHQALVTFQQTFGRSESIIFTLAPGDGDVFTRRTLGMIDRLGERADRLPHVHHVHSLSRFQRIRAEGEDLIIEELISDPDALTDDDLAELRRIALAEPRLVHRLVSARGVAANVVAIVDLPEDDSAARADLARVARALRDEFRREYPELELHLTGSVIIDQAFKDASRKDLRTLAPAMVTILFLLIGAILQSFAGMFSVMVVMVLTVVIALGVAGWLGIPFSIVSASAPGLIVTLAIADSVHIVTTVFQRLRDGANRAAAVAHAMRINLQPVFLTSLTTAIGFLSLNFSESPPFRDLGNIIALGVGTAFLLSALLLPALISIVPTRAGPAQRSVGRPALRRLAGFVIRRERWLRIGLVTLAVAASLGLFRIELDTHYQQLYSRRLEIRRAIDFQIDRMGVFAAISYPMESGESGGIAEPDFLAVLDGFARWYRQQPGVLHVDSVADTVMRMNQGMFGGDPAEARIPDSREAVAQYLLFYEMSLPPGGSPGGDMDVTHRAAAVHVMAGFLTSHELRAMDAAAQAWLRENAPAALQTPGAGTGLVWAHLTQRNIHGMALGTAGALVLISLCLTVALRSIRLGLISLVPNLLPPIVAFGLWGGLVGQIGLPATVIAAMTIGIVVDDTIHLLSKYARARHARGMHPERAIRYIFEIVGPAVCTTTAALAVGFSVLALSPFGMTSVIGRLCVIIIVLALAFDLLLLPPLLLAMERRAARREGKGPGLTNRNSSR